MQSLKVPFARPRTTEMITSDAASGIRRTLLSAFGDVPQA